MDNVLKGYIEKLKSVDTVEEYETFISNLHQMLKQESYKNDVGVKSTPTSDFSSLTTE